jgi:hypothetical protein
MAVTDIDERLERVFAAAGVDGFLHAVDLDGGGEVRHRSGEPWTGSTRRCASWACREPPSGGPARRSTPPC